MELIVLEATDTASELLDADPSYVPVLSGDECETPGRVSHFLGLTIGGDGTEITLATATLDGLPDNASALPSPEYLDGALVSPPPCGSRPGLLCTRAFVGAGG